MKKPCKLSHETGPTSTRHLAGTPVCTHLAGTPVCTHLAGTPVFGILRHQPCRCRRIQRTGVPAKWVALPLFSTDTRQAQFFGSYFQCLTPDTKCRGVRTRTAFGRTSKSRQNPVFCDTSRHPPSLRKIAEKILHIWKFLDENVSWNGSCRSCGARMNFCTFLTGATCPDPVKCSAAGTTGGNFYRVWNHNAVKITARTRVGERKICFL